MMTSSEKRRSTERCAIANVLRFVGAIVNVYCCNPEDGNADEAVVSPEAACGLHSACGIQMTKHRHDKRSPDVVDWSAIALLKPFPLIVGAGAKDTVSVKFESFKDVYIGVGAFALTASQRKQHTEAAHHNNHGYGKKGKGRTLTTIYAARMLKLETGEVLSMPPACTPFPLVKFKNWDKHKDTSAVFHIKFQADTLSLSVTMETKSKSQTSWNIGPFSCACLTAPWSAPLASHVDKLSIHMGLFLIINDDIVQILSS